MRLEPSCTHFLDIIQALLSPEVFHPVNEPPTHLLDFGLIYCCETDSEVGPTSPVSDLICRSEQEARRNQHQVFLRGQINP